MGRAMSDTPLNASSADVWLRGNVRPVLVAAAATIVSGSLIITALVFAGAPAWVITGVAVLVAAGAGSTVALAIESARPRLARHGDHVLIRLAPWQQEEVPLEVLECFFLGSSPVGKHPASSSCGGAAGESGGADAAGDECQPTRRRGTLAIRLAERSREYARRSVSLPWGGWVSGTIVVDGLWCEPLTPALVRDLTGRLVAAKREAS